MNRQDTAPGWQVEGERAGNAEAWKEADEDEARGFADRWEKTAPVIAGV